MERWDDLQYRGLYLLQDDTLPRFTADAVHLVHFLRLGSGDTVLDVGCGTGVLSVLGCAYTGAAFTGIDIRGDLVALALRSEERNGQGIRFLERDVLTAPALFGEGAFSAAVWNPPYFSAGDVSPDEARKQARHAPNDILGDMARAVFRLLKNGGKLFLCCPCTELPRMMTLLSNNRLEPKRLRLVTHTPGDAPYLALMEAKKDGHCGMKCEPLLFDKSGINLYNN